MSNQFPNPWEKTLREFKKYQRQLPKKIGKMALKEIQGYFRIGGYRDTSTVFWTPRKPNAWKKKGSRSNLGSALLIKSGRLRRSLREASDSNYARVVTDVPYAEALHKGFKGKVTQRIAAFKRRGGTVKAHTRVVNRDMAARPFLTVGNAFMNVVDREVINDLNKIFLSA